MNTLNSVLIEGNLVKDVSPKQTSKGTMVCQLSLASNRFFFKDEETQKEVSFFEVEVWDKEAAKCQTLEKGRGLRIMGRLKQDRWVDEQGKTHSKVKIVGEKVDLKPVFKKQQEEEKGPRVQKSAPELQAVPAF